MAGLNYDRFVRFLTRSAELGAAAGKPPIIGVVYKEVAEAKIDAFLAAHKAVGVAMTAFAKENREALKALEALDGPYRVARSTVVAVLPETVLPETLKVQPTETDKLNAIEALLDIIDDHAGKPWADTLLQGEFGQQAPKTVKELTEAITASTARSEALATRARTFGPAYESYLAFKRVVRDALGAKSNDYRRIHLRAPSGKDEMDNEPAAGEEASAVQPAEPPKGSPPSPPAEQGPADQPPA